MASSRRRASSSWRTEFIPPSRGSLGGSSRGRRSGYGACLHELFEAQVEQAGDATAVAFDGGSIRYRDLDAQANQLARHLQRSGAGPEIPIGVCLSRSIDLVVALLAVLKAGAVYVPLDPRFPPARGGFVLRDARVRILVTSRVLEEGLRSEWRGRIVLIDRTQEQVNREPAHDLEVAVGPTHRAYVTYTSGSTGQPKGVEILHGAAAGYLRYLAARGHVRPADVVLQVAPVSFDASIREIMGALAVGARLVLLPDELVRQPAALRAAIARERVTVLLGAVPSLLRLLYSEDAPMDASSRSLRRILVSGEALDAATVALVRARADPGARLVNHYGPTECTMTSTFHVVEKVPGDRIPIGRPHPGCVVHLLDALLDPVPRGDVGQVCIAGPSLARGYLNRPALTAERFVPDPLAARPGSRMYLTGDLARLLPNDELEFLGRVDDQINLHGVRIEPGEVEAALRRHDGVSQAVVVLGEGAGTTPQLVAHVVPAAGHEPKATEMREALLAWLPESMVPARFVLRDSLPLTPNGKTDRAALRAPAVRSRRRSGRAPGTSLEAELAEMFAEVLRLKHVGTQEDFFDLGGDSILGIRLLARVGRRLARDVPLRTLFDAPSVAELAKRLGPGPRPRPAAGVPRRARVGAAPLSSAQQRLWVLDKLTPATPVHNVVSAFRLVGRLHRDALQAGVDAIVARHDALRTSFPEGDGTPAAIVHETRRVRVDVAATGSDTDVGARLNAYAARSFDMAAEPLLRVVVLREAPDRATLLVSAHHIVVDGWSLGLLFAELAAEYAAALSGRSAGLPTPPIQYADYAAWQRERLHGRRLRDRLAFWRAHLGGAPPALELPTDRPRPPEQRHRGAVLRKPVAAGRVAALEQLGRDETASLFMVLLTAWAILLHRLSGQDDLVIGVPVAGRERVEVERLIGLFLNTLPIRIRLAGTPTVRQLLRQVRGLVLDALDHADLPFDLLVESLRPQRSLARMPVFQVLFDLQPAVSLHLAGLTVTPVEVQTGAAQFDLSLTFEQRGGAMDARFTYDTDLFDASTIGRLAARLDVLMDAMTADPDLPIDRLPVLTDPERRQLLEGWNDTKTFASRGCLHELFERQAMRSPEMVAVRFQEHQLTYGELEARANRLASRLRNAGVGPDAPVAIFLERSTDLVAGILGVLKAGGAYVPLDPGHPAARLALVLDDAGPRCVLTSRELCAKLPITTAAPVLLDDHAEEAPTATASRVRPENLAYLMYTSGSTGRPKGVEVEHRAVVNLLAAMQALLGLDPSDVLLSVTTPAFDIATLELFLPLSVGAQVVIAPRSSVLDPIELRARLAETGATVMQATPATWQALADTSPAGTLVDKALCGGEALHPGLARSLMALSGQAWNVYGPTETTIWSTAGILRDATSPVSIGRPIANTRAYIVDAHLEPVPAGVAGDLCIAGPGLARGYHARPDLTADRFRPDPLASEPGSRLYRTGDLARWLPDGRIEHRGRSDRQVKIRGHRVESGDVEAALADHPGIRGAAVITQDDGSGGVRLVACTVGERSVTASELRSFLAGRLPEYMIPSAFMMVDDLPVTPAGKVDHAALRTVATARQKARAERALPRTPVEHELGRIWCEVLELDGVGLDEDFFELGGHSLLGTRVLARVWQRFGVELPLRVLFAHRTIAELSGDVEAALPNDGA